MRLVVMGSLLFVVLVTSPALGLELEPGGSFFDDDDSVHEGAIEAIAALGITKGCRQPDFYCPTAPVTRGQMAAFLVRATGLESSSAEVFDDVEGSIFAAEIEALAAAGVTRGCGPSRFCPDRAVTRGEMAAFLVRAFGLAPGPDRFEDVGGHVFESDIGALAAAGITRGCDPPADRRFCPDRPVTRAEMATFLARALNLDLVEVPERPALTLGFSGDILIHMPVTNRAAVNGRPYDFGPMFEPISHIVRNVDLALCHLEVPLASDNRNLSGYPSFNAPREVAVAIAGAGYAGCSTASNHSFDRGESGIRSTLSVLTDLGLGQAGMAAAPDDAGRATIYQLGEVTVAHLSATWWLNGLQLPAGKEWLVQMLDTEQLIRQAHRARQSGADIVVVSMHCCLEYTTLPTAYQRRVATELIRSPDIDLVVGHHAHVVQPIEEVEGEMIVYGLGNFLSAQRSRPATQDGVFVEVEFALRAGEWTTRRVRAHPTWVEGGSFRVLSAAEANRASWRRTERALTSLDAAVEVVD